MSFAIRLLVVSSMAMIGLSADGRAATLSYPTHTTGVTANTSGEVGVPCPQGTKVVGGGVYLSGTSLETEVRSSAPYDSQSDGGARPDDGWSGIGNAGPANESIRGNAICVDEAKLDYVRAERRVRPSSRAAAVARCERGWKVIGGGVETASGNPSTQIVLVESFHRGASSVEAGDGWRGTVANGSAERVKMKVWAICARRVVVNLNNTFNGIPNFPADTQDYLETQECSGNHQLTGGGGVLINRPLGSEIATLEPVDSASDGDLEPDDLWRTWFNNQTGAAQQRSVFALCTRFRD